MSTLSSPALSRPLRRRLDHSGRAWLLAWFGGPVIGIANGVVRETLYAERVGDLAAHQISTVSAIALFAGYFWFLHRRWPLPSAQTALAVGLVWLAATVGFEFGFGHYVDGKSWSELAGDYNLAKGHLWPLVLAFLFAGPEAIRRLAARGEAR